MYVGEIMKADCANGTGTRVSVFVSGCLNHCKGCFQPQTWDFHYGIPFTSELEDMVIKELSESYYEGLTILGGEPFELQNQPDVLALILRVKKELPEKNIWMYTGYTYHQDLVPSGCRYIPNVTDTILDHIDVLVDGRFEEEKKNLSLYFRGSENQRVIDMKKTRTGNEVILVPFPQ